MNWILKDGRKIELLTPEELKSLPGDTKIISISGQTRFVAACGQLPPNDDTRQGFTAWAVFPKTKDEEIKKLYTIEEVQPLINALEYGRFTTTGELLLKAAKFINQLQANTEGESYFTPHLERAALRCEEALASFYKTKKDKNGCN